MLWGPIPSSLQVGFVFFYPFMIIYLTLIFMDITDSEMYVLKKKKKKCSQCSCLTLDNIAQYFTLHDIYFLLYVVNDIA